MNKLGLAAPLAVAAALLAAGCGADSSAHSSSTTAAPASSGAVDVKLSEWAIALAQPSAKAGKVTFDVTNEGKLPHEMVVLKTDKSADALGKGSRVPEDGAQGEVEDLEAGGSKSVTLSLTKGHYVLVCNLPGHYSAGMATDFTVS